MKRQTVATACAALFLCAAATHAAPRIALWNPVKGTSESRASIDLPTIRAAAASLGKSGAAVSLLTAEELADDTVFSSARYDALFFIGVGFPRSTIPVAKRFSDEGGVLVSLEAGVPFLIALEQGKEGFWKLSPDKPTFAWQTYELLTHIGLKYIYEPERHSQGVRHSPTALLKAFADADLPNVNGRLDSRWVIPLENARYIPLIRSRRMDGIDVPGPLYIIKNADRTSIVCTSPVFTLGASPDFWKDSEATLAAIAKLATAIRAGKWTPAPDAIVALDIHAEPEARTPLDRASFGSVDPENAQALARWGLFNGSCMELGGIAKRGQSPTVPPSAATTQFPSALEPGASVGLELPATTAIGDAPTFIRIRGAYTETGAGLKLAIGGDILWNELFRYIDTREPGNFSKSLSGVPSEFTRIVFVPADRLGGKTLALSNPGHATLTFDAVQLEHQREPRTRCIGLGAGLGEKNNYPVEESKRWGGLRMSLRTQRIGKPDDPDRFAKIDKLFNTVASKTDAVQPILEGTPDWAAISAERLDDAIKAGRPTTVPPDPAKYAEITEAVVKRYGDRISMYEIWNEADITQFYRGTAQEYVTLFHTVAPIIRRLDPAAKIMPAGMAGFREPFIDELVKGGVIDASDMIAFHPYAGKSPAWDLPYGLVEGALMSRGRNIEIFCNESGFPSNNQEWFSRPPDLNEETQRRSIDVAMSRLLSMGLAKLSVFNAGGDHHGFGLFRADGSAKPAYAVFSDYARLNGEGSTRLDVGMTHADGQPLLGVYAAASQHADGRATVVVNPSECEAVRPAEAFELPLSANAQWVHFFCGATFENGAVTITPEPGKAGGFYKTASVNPTRTPHLDVVVSGDDAEWELLLKTQDKTSMTAIPKRGAGTVSLDLPALLPPALPDNEVEISFRIHKGPATISKVMFRPAEGQDRDPVLPIVLRAPMAPGCKGRVTAICDGVSTPLPAKVNNGWIETALPLSRRTVVEFE
ncbi:MAG: hypothetical protein ACOX9C_00400 [Kiritimatiellia bacterium]|jgi:hypothetical protein